MGIRLDSASIRELCSMGEPQSRLSEYAHPCPTPAPRSRLAAKRCRPVKALDIGSLAQAPRPSRVVIQGLRAILAVTPNSVLHDIARTSKTQRGRWPLSRTARRTGPTRICASEVKAGERSIMQYGKRRGRNLPCFHESCRADRGDRRQRKPVGGEIRDAESTHSSRTRPTTLSLRSG